VGVAAGMVETSSVWAELALAGVLTLDNCIGLMTCLLLCTYLSEPGAPAASEVIVPTEDLAKQGKTPLSRPMTTRTLLPPQPF
jgi:hypothetical protein